MRALLVLLLLVPITASAQAPRELDVGGPTSELYIQNRPPAPAAPVLPPAYKELLAEREPLRDARRTQAIGLLRDLLGESPTGEIKAEVVFRLAELLWEDARRKWLVDMDGYTRELERCTRGACATPHEPRLDLAEAERHYRTLHDEFPDFRRSDLVTYLLGFAAREDHRASDALARFHEVIDRFPSSRLVGDAWMMIGEHHFAATEWTRAKDAYARVPDDAAVYDLALFKRAWCEWKLDDPSAAQGHFKEVIADTLRTDRLGSPRAKKHGPPLREEALGYLVVMFTEDRTVGAKEVFDFLGSVDPQYSRELVVKVAESYAAQAEWQRSADAFAFLIGLDRTSVDAAAYQRRIVDNWTTGLDTDRADEATRTLLDDFGPRSAWATAQPDHTALAQSLADTEALARRNAMQAHAVAQRDEQGLRLAKHDGCVAKPALPDALTAAYTRAADAYASYLGAFDRSADAALLRYYRADILCFKLGKLEQAGDAYLAVGKTAPIGPQHKDALRSAMNAFQQAHAPGEARPEEPQARTRVEAKLVESMNLYATLFRGDPALVQVIFNFGRAFYDRGDYDRAVEQFALIVDNYPGDPNVGAAADRIVDAIAKAKNWDKLVFWTHKLTPLPSFASADRQRLLHRVAADALDQIAERYAGSHDYEHAAQTYAKAATETLDPTAAAQALTNRGVMFEQAKQPERAADAYLEIATRYADQAPAAAERAAFAGAVVYERSNAYDRAAQAYELVVTRFGKTGVKVADALFDAGVLRQALGEHAFAIAHYRDYARRFKDRKDAADVAFNIGVVYEDAGDDGHAREAFVDYASAHAATHRVVEALTRAGRASFRLGHVDHARAELAAAQTAWRTARDPAARAWAAEARFYEGELVLRAFDKLSFDVSPAKLAQVLAAKAKLLDDGEKLYNSVFDYKEPRWAIVAMFRIGQLYENFADTLANAPAGANSPKVADYVVQLQGLAVERYTAAYAKAKELQIYDDNTTKIRAALERLAGQDYVHEHEARDHQRVGDRPPTAPIIDDPIR